MIERLMNEERPYGEPKYGRLSEQIVRLTATLYEQLDADGRDRLDQLSGLYMRQETAVLRDAFADGFWTAVELMLEFERWKHGRQM